MAKAKVDKNGLVKMAKALNKLELTDEPVATKGDAKQIAEDFIQAIEEIDDDGKIDKVKDKIVDFYEDLLEKVEDKDDDDENGDNGEDFDRDALEEELEDFDVKAMKKFIKDNELEIDTKVKKDDLEEVIEEILDAMEAKAGDAKGKDDDDGDSEEFDRDAWEEKLEDMDYKEVKKFMETSEISIDTKLKKKTWEDDAEDIIEEILDAMEKKDDTKEPKKKKKKNEKKGKKKSKSEDRDYPKGIRKGTLPAICYDLIAEGCTWKDLAKRVGKEKKKKADQVMGLVLRTVSRKVAAAVPVVVTFNGDDNTAIFALGDDD